MSIPAPQPVRAPPCPGVGSPLGVRHWNSRLGECTATCPVCEWHFIVRGDAVPEHSAELVYLVESVPSRWGFRPLVRWVGPPDEAPDRCAGCGGHL